MGGEFLDQLSDCTSRNRLEGNMVIVLTAGKLMVIASVIQCITDGQTDDSEQKMSGTRPNYVPRCFDPN
jgi:hypothetical protein